MDVTPPRGTQADGDIDVTTRTVEELEEMLDEFRNHQLPLARIKKIMKSDEDVRMISAEAPVLFAKGCELFVLELTLRSWAFTEEGKRRTLQRNDIATAINRTDVFDFLAEVIPKEEINKPPKKDEGSDVSPVLTPVDPMTLYQQHVHMMKQWQHIGGAPEEIRAAYQRQLEAHQAQAQISGVPMPSLGAAHTATGSSGYHVNAPVSTAASVLGVKQEGGVKQEPMHNSDFNL
eukprot:GFYU01001094.1.p1 GENE.GFYU01001094.1~~GFYU01001094.1.p1  ORF type:complete len:233 (+),score=50.22 GFYU01001094.1:254-952(+)